MRFRLNRPSSGLPYARQHAHTVFLPLRIPADASTAWRLSPHPAHEPQPRPRALAGAAARPRPGRAFANPYSAAAALSDTSGIAPRGDRRRAAQRPRRMGLCSEVADGGEIPWDHPALSEQIRAVLSRRFSAQNRSAYSSQPALNLLAAIQTNCMPGTLHHSGNKPAPPSDHIPLARRSAFAGGPDRLPTPGNSATQTGLDLQGARKFGCAAAADTAIGTGGSPPLSHGDTRAFHEWQRRGIYADQVVKRFGKSLCIWIGSGSSSKGSGKTKTGLPCWPRAASR